MRLFRDEACPLDPGQLDKNQQEAFCWLVERLQQAATEPRAASDDSVSKTLPKGIEQRTSRVLLLHGDRGVGKTTVLLSVMRTCGKIKRLDDPEVLAALERQQQARPDEFAARLVESVRHLSRVSQRILWLEPLDMERLPQSANLLATLLVRVEDGAKRVCPSWGSDEAEANSVREGLWLQDSAFDDLQSLKTDVALAWDGHAPQRASQLEPDPFAIEVLKAEHARLNLNPRLRHVLEGLAQRLARSPILDDPIFVLPVDDSDLNPTRVVELLRLVRLVSVPRLLVIMLGDGPVIQQMVHLQMAGQLNDLAGGASGLPMKAFRVNLGRFAGEFAGQAFRKMVPPSQRYEILRTEPEEALKIPVPSHCEQRDSHTLWELLREVKIKPATAVDSGGWTLFGRSVATLADIVSYQPAWGEAKRPLYSGRTYFDASRREIYDVATTLCGLFHNTTLRPIPYQRARRTVLGLVVQQVQEDPLLTPDHRHNLTEIVSELDRFDRSYTHWPLRFSYQQGRPVEGVPTPATPVFIEDWNWQRAIEYEDIRSQPVRQTEGEELEPRGTRPRYQPRQEQSPAAEFASETALSNPVASSEDVPPALHYRFVRTPAHKRTIGLLTIVRDLLAHEWPAARPHLDQKEWLAWARWPVMPEVTVNIPWPHLPWPNFFEYEVFLELWQTSVKRYRDARSEWEESAYLTYFWLAAPLLFLTDASASDVRELLAAKGSQLPWGALDERASRLVGMYQQPRGRDPRWIELATSYLASTALVACFECCAPAPVASELITKGTSFQRIWWMPEVDRVIRRERARHAYRFAKQGQHLLGLAVLCPWRLSRLLANHRLLDAGVLTEALTCWLKKETGSPWTEHGTLASWNRGFTDLRELVQLRPIDTRLLVTLVLSLTHPMNRIRRPDRQRPAWPPDLGTLTMENFLKHPDMEAGDLCPGANTLGRLWYPPDEAFLSLTAQDPETRRQEPETRRAKARRPNR